MLLCSRKSVGKCNCKIQGIRKSLVSENLFLRSHKQSLHHLQKYRTIYCNFLNRSKSPFKFPSKTPLKASSRKGKLHEITKTSASKPSSGKLPISFNTSKRSKIQKNLSMVQPKELNVIPGTPKYKKTDSGFSKIKKKVNLKLDKIGTTMRPSLGYTASPSKKRPKGTSLVKDNPTKLTRAKPLTRTNSKTPKCTIFDSSTHSSHILAKIFSKDYSAERKSKNHLIFKEDQEEPESGESSEEVALGNNFPFCLLDPYTNETNQPIRNFSDAIVHLKSCMSQPKLEENSSQTNSMTDNSEQSENRMAHLRFQTVASGNSLAAKNYHMNGFKTNINENEDYGFYVGPTPIANKSNSTKNPIASSEISVNLDCISIKNKTLCKLTKASTIALKRGLTRMNSNAFMKKTSPEALIVRIGSPGGISFAVKSIPGVVPYKEGDKCQSPVSRIKTSKELKSKKNQDAFLIVKNLLNFDNYWMFSVFDGHGPDGHTIANYAKTSLPKVMNKNYERVKKFDQRINILPCTSTCPSERGNSMSSSSTRLVRGIDSLKEIHQFLPDISYRTMKDVMKESIIDIDRSLGTQAKYSGTTCCSVSILGDKLLCTNVGDSRAIMISKNQSLTPNSLKDSLSKSHQNSSILKQRLRKININKEVMKKWKVTPLSSDHKPINEERNRILATGFGSVDRLEDQKGAKHGPFRVFDQYGLDGGLAMSRSIGDHKLTKSGVIANPEFSEHKITEDDKFLIIASDGIWEYLSNEGWFITFLHI
ncbi:unnamed protein product [Moneuplotes crassus]|uniref:PPM-type phosphatase domain-containing protein n=1 Tax=Euplotes crassus TaxID=5936 RepID=A0AAD1Y3Q5_EUPCR|nr:unnamed protein product [Moneuplotes crassus]